MVATTDPDFPCSIFIDVPLHTERLATIALKAIQVDKELSPLVRRILSVPDNGHLLRVEYKATTNRMLRVAVNGFMESLRLVVAVMEQLDVDVLEQPIYNDKSVN